MPNFNIKVINENGISIANYINYNTDSCSGFVKNLNYNNAIFELSYKIPKSVDISLLNTYIKYIKRIIPKPIEIKITDSTVNCKFNTSIVSNHKMKVFVIFTLVRYPLYSYESFNKLMFDTLDMMKVSKGKCNFFLSMYYMTLLNQYDHSFKGLFYKVLARDTNKNIKIKNYLEILSNPKKQVSTVNGFMTQINTGTNEWRFKTKNKSRLEISNTVKEFGINPLFITVAGSFLILGTIKPEGNKKAEFLKLINYLNKNH